MEVINTSGRRKTSVARIYMTAGQGNITINGREMKAYFGNELLENIVNQPLATVEQLGVDLDAHARLALNRRSSGSGASSDTRSVCHSSPCDGR